MSGSDSASERDAYFVDAGKLIIDKEKASIGMLQRMFKIGFNRAARIMDQLCRSRCGWTRKREQSQERYSCLWKSLNST